eukprot:scaffold39121_cov139-Skeletonema_marinoi.AAC.1
MMKFINIAAIAILLQTAKISSAVESNETTAALNATDETAATTNTTTADEGPAFAADADATTADEFTPIDGEFSTVDSVMISPRCPSDSMASYPYPVFTIQPSTVAYVSSFPADLVTVAVSGNELQFEWNDAVANGATSGGVQIGLPSDQFNKLHLGNSLKAQILDGFTSVQRLEVNGFSTLKATLTSNTNSALSVSAEGASTAHVVTSTTISSVRSLGASTVQVQAESVSSIQAGGASKLDIDGNVSGGGSVQGFSTLRITGDMSGTLTNEGASTINANTITGSISTSFPSGVTAASCDNVQGDFSCKVGDPPIVDVDVSLYEEISTGTWPWSTVVTCKSGNGEEFWSQPSTGSSTSSTIAAVAGATTLVAFLLV